MFLAMVVVGMLGGLALLWALRRVLLHEQDVRLRRIIVLGLVAKLAGTAARFTVMGDLYGGRGDFNRYHRAGVELAGQIRSGSLPDQARETGTPFMEFIVGVAYTAIPSRLWAGFLLFALLSFVGAFLFLQALRLAVPLGNHRLYAGLIFFTPTMVFWPSSLGKEAWLVFTLGVAAYGAARVLRRARFGYWIAALGGAGVFMVRPHMGALFGLAFVGAYVLRFRDPDVRVNVVGSVIGLAVVALGAGYAFANFSDELPAGRGVEEPTFDDVAAETTRRTTTGGSEFDSRPVRGPGDFIHAAITVPFRPFPTEGHNLQAQLAGFEGVVLLGLILLSLPRLVALPRAVVRQPFVTLAFAYTVGFIIAFSNVGNFGILTRQRAQLLPFLFVLLAYGLQRRRDERGPLLVPKAPEVTPPPPPPAPNAGVLGSVEAASPDRAPITYTQASFDLVIDLPPDAVHPRPPDTSDPPLSGPSPRSAAS